MLQISRQTITGCAGPFLFACSKKMIAYPMTVMSLHKEMQCKGPHSSWDGNRGIPPEIRFSFAVLFSLELSVINTGHPLQALNDVSCVSD